MPHALQGHRPRLKRTWACWMAAKGFAPPTSRVSAATAACSTTSGRSTTCVPFSAEAAAASCSRQAGCLGDF